MLTTVIVTTEFIEWYEALSLEEQASIDRVVALLEERGAILDFPLSSGIKGSRFPAMRELRVQHAGNPYRILYAFDPVRQAVLLVGGVKTGKGTVGTRTQPGWLTDCLRSTCVENRSVPRKSGIAKL